MGISRNIKITIVGKGEIRSLNFNSWIVDEVHSRFALKRLPSVNGIFQSLGHRSTQISMDSFWENKLIKIQIEILLWKECQRKECQAEKMPSGENAKDPIKIEYSLSKSNLCNVASTIFKFLYTILHRESEFQQQYRNCIWFRYLLPKWYSHIIKFRVEQYVKMGNILFVNFYDFKMN